MSTTTAPERPDPGLSPDHPSLRQPKLPPWAGYAAIGALVVLAALLYFGLGLPMVGAIILAWLVCGLAYPLWSLLVEGSRKATDRLVTIGVLTAFVLALVPLVSIIMKVVAEGAGALSAEFLTYSMRNVIGEEQGGIYHALIGTLLITAGATIISVPIGLFTAIYLVEYARDNRLGHWIRFLVDVMTGIPSIVAGLFAYSLFVALLEPGIRLGVGGSVALSVLMVPVVVRSCEEMLKLVPNELREASYALGVPKWRTVVKVVIPTALAGIVTGITLAIARIIGETAPLLLIAGSTTSTNFNLFDGNMMTLPVFAYSEISSPGMNPELSTERAWGAALVLMIIVMLLNLIARVVSYLFSPKGEK
ncbi:phosphate ABC transporter permease PstA [Solicola gregarius]|uniref:Phosphate transport system permease protein PstA n=1 Tax=Solicola gregarius TaxID=2908642 RepID=A0AA46YJI3_9ACTN|nr:phosphate ABC transporter permease PstA [Solicola gregarius]UYM03614.1 phosphate ABC transporter permease PstA [Solicola gregarius]